jgi:hypothetical protein
MFSTHDDYFLKKYLLIKLVINSIVDTGTQQQTYKHIVTCIPIARQRVGKQILQTQALNNRRASIAR